MPKHYDLFYGFLLGGLVPLAIGIAIAVRSPTGGGIDSTGGFISGVIPLHALLLIFIAAPLLGIVGSLSAYFIRKQRKVD